MATANTWTNDDGLVVPFGARDTHNIEDAVVHSLGRKKEVEVHIHYSTLSSLATGTLASTKAISVPAGAVIEGGYLRVEEDITDLTSLVVGLKDTVDGSTIDADGLLTSTAEAALEDDDVVALDGALLGAKLATRGTVSLDVTGTAPTAGRAVLFFTYLDTVVDADAPAVITGAI